MTTLATPLRSRRRRRSGLTQLNEAVASLRERTEAATEDAQARFEKASSLQRAARRGSASLEELKGQSSPPMRSGAGRRLRRPGYHLLQRPGRARRRGSRPSAHQPLVAENIERAEKVYNDAVELTEDAWASSRPRPAPSVSVPPAGWHRQRQTVDAAAAVEEAAEGVAEKLEEAAGHRGRRRQVKGRRRRGCCRRRHQGSGPQGSRQEGSGQARPGRQVISRSNNTPVVFETTGGL